MRSCSFALGVMIAFVMSITLQMYEERKGEPPIARDMPPVAGKIAWSRQLSRKIEEPMLIFVVCFTDSRFVKIIFVE